MEFVAIAFAIVAIAAVVYGMSREASKNREIVQLLLMSNRDILDRAMFVRESQDQLLADTVRKVASMSDGAFSLAQQEIQRDVALMNRVNSEPPRQTNVIEDEDLDGVIESEWSPTEVAVG